MRKTGIELLRIFSMLAVIMGHCLLFDIHFFEFKPFTANYFVSYFIKALTVPAVNCYMLISGYFLVKSKFSFKKLFIFYSQVWFYSALSLVLEHGGFDARNILNHVFPIQGGVYWYATAYFAVYCLAPLMNRAIWSMNQKKFQLSLLGLLTLFSFLPTLFYFNDTYRLEEGLSFVWLCVVYMTGAYLRLYPPKIRSSRLFAVYTGCFIIMILQNAVSDISPLLKYLPIGYVQIHYKSPLVYLMAICIFLLFERIRWESKWIVRIASTTFGIYLAGEIARKAICELPFMSSLKESPLWIVHILLSTLAVFILCSCFEELRKQAFRWLRIDSLFLKAENKIREKLGLSDIHP